MNFLVAYDGSEGARAALRAATSLARTAGASLEVVRLLDRRADLADVVAETVDEAVRRVVAEWAADINAAVAALDVPATVTVQEVSRGEDIAEAIARLASEKQSEIVVISSRRASGLKGVVTGSVTQGVLRAAPCPVLVVRP